MNKYGGKIPERDANCYTQMILEGLLDIHEKGLIHSDLKLGNILHTYSDSKRTIGNSNTVPFFGGIPWLSCALDIWLLDCIVIEIITGRFPWETYDRNDLRDKFLRGESPNIPKDVLKLGRVSRGNVLLLIQTKGRILASYYVIRIFFCIMKF
ncbi:mitogen-activated protein kinase kinae kinase MCK1-like [Gossypium arboreum]|uniref:mitogen-activated protein kinase kinae kinase MCK1-like n=1 Tax=Gossypium arboreum TaxID=29729 RepID=UPI0022F1AE40|nr:mitogen-activated protein kinase kinae kinase MCK1-like [Gossypium arboreum]